MRNSAKRHSGTGRAAMTSTMPPVTLIAARPVFARGYRDRRGLESIPRHNEERPGIVIQAVLPYDASGPEAERCRKLAKEIVAMLRNAGFSCSLTIPNEDE